MSAPRPAEGPAPRDNTSLEAFFAEADDILEHWNGSYDAGQWNADGSHQPEQIRGDYYIQDRAAQQSSDQLFPSIRAQTPPLQGGYSRQDDSGWLTPGYEDLVMRWWLGDVWYASLFGVIAPDDADWLHDRWSRYHNPAAFDELIRYRTGRSRAQMTEQLATVLNAFAPHLESGQTWQLPGGYVMPGDGLLPVPAWEECLLPAIEPNDDLERVRQVYLHSWAIIGALSDDMPDVIPVVVALTVESMVRELLRMRAGGYRLTTGFHGIRIALSLDRQTQALRIRMTVRAGHPSLEEARVWLERLISEEELVHSRPLTRYDLPPVTSHQGFSTVQMPASAIGRLREGFLGVAQASAEAGEAVEVLLDTAQTDPEVSRRRGPGVEAQQSPYGPPDRRHRR
jgi:hypothetical protein